MKRNGYTAVELVIVLALFSIGYFSATWIISGKLDVNYEQMLYEQKISAIEKQATIYASSNTNLFENDKTAYLTIDALAQESAIITDADGNVIDPRNNKNNLNNIKIKLTKKDDKISAKALI